MWCIILSSSYNNEMDFLFKNATVLTMQKECDVRRDTCIGVLNDKISYIGPYDDTIKAKRTIDCTNKVIIPGLYNCHTHTPMSLLRGYENNKSLHEWLNNAIFPAEDYFRNIKGATYIGALLSIADMISSGTVSFSDMYFNMYDIATAVHESGMKATLCNPILCRDDESFDYKKDLSYIETKAVLEDYVKKDGNIKVSAGIHAEYTSTPCSWSQVIDYAVAHNLDVQIHLSETEYEHTKCKERYGLTPTQMFNNFGLFELKTTAAHGVWLEQQDIDIIREKDVSLVYNPISNLKLASGVALAHEWVLSGINVALGTDGMASNNSNDLFEEMKIASILQKNKYKDTTIMDAELVLKIATINGAVAQGRQSNSGKIVEGYDADIVVLDFNNTRQTACYDYFSNIVFSGSGRDVDITMCNGKILYENGKYKTIDIEKLLFYARKIIGDFKNNR